MTSFVVFVSIPVLAQNNPAPRRSIYMAFSKAEAKDGVRGLYVAIMGGVVNPGTYHLDPSELNLHSLLKRAGGLSVDATRTVRVIRQGRLNHQISISEDSDKTDNLLTPGDLVIVDSKQSRDVLGKVTEFVDDPVTVSANYEVAAPNPGIQVALLNVMDYPLVVRLRPEEATTGHVIDQLGQSSEIIANTRVIAPNARTRNVDGGASSIVLSSGSAIVFDRGAVQRDRLPPSLPRPIESEIAMGAQSGLIGSPNGQSPELRNVGQQALNSSTNSVNDSQLSQPMIADPIPSLPPSFGLSSDDQKADLQVPALNSNPRVTIVPFTGSARIQKSSTGNSTSDDVMNEQIPQPDDTVNENNAVSPVEAPSLSFDDPAESPATGSSIPLAIATLAVSGTLIAAGVHFRKRLERHSIALSKLPAEFAVSPITESAEPVNFGETVANTLLERMIKNELPITIENVEFPADMALQGRIVAKPILRVDGPQDVLGQQGPHFATSDRELGKHSVQQVIAEADASESMPRRPHFLSKEKQHVAASTGSPQEPRMPSSGRGSERSSAPLANALFELEQGGRS
jgi:hypothetical protein